MLFKNLSLQHRSIKRVVWDVIFEIWTCKSNKYSLYLIECILNGFPKHSEIRTQLGETSRRRVALGYLICAKILRLSPISVLTCTERDGTCEKWFLLIKAFSHMQQVCDVHVCHGKRSSSLVQKSTPRRHCRIKERYTERWKHFEWQGQLWIKIKF